MSAFGIQSLCSCGRFIKTMWLARPFVVVGIVFFCFFMEPKLIKAANSFVSAFALAIAISFLVRLPVDVSIYRVERGEVDCGLPAINSAVLAF